MKAIPKIDKLMTPMPHTVNPDLPMKTAHNMMRDFHVRHIPVLSGGKLVGIITDRDISLASSFNHSEEFKVDDVMTPDPYAVTPDTPLDRAVLEMSKHKYGCAIVQQENGKVVGIFTATDAMRVLGEVLQENFKPTQN